jgi:hypothetical protein
MIPTKRTKYSFPPEGYAKMSKEEKQAVHDRLNKRPPVTELQKLAQKENFALFVVESIKGQLKHLYPIGPLTNARVNNILSELEGIKSDIKYVQSKRKICREKDK